MYPTLVEVGVADPSVLVAVPSAVGVVPRFNPYQRYRYSITYSEQNRWIFGVSPPGEPPPLLEPSVRAGPPLPEPSVELAPIAVPASAHRFGAVVDAIGDRACFFNHYCRAGCSRLNDRCRCLLALCNAPKEQEHSWPYCGPHIASI